MKVTNYIGVTMMTAREDGVIGVCKICGRDAHYGARIETDRLGREIELFACYDCIQVCHLIAVGRMPCKSCGKTGHEGPPVQVET